ncbi:MAG: response regulator, partial [Candidatus Helarchaeota archaeon]
MRILITDDDVTFLKKMEKMLSLEQHSIITTCSGEQALSELRERNIDLIVTDLKMAGMSGWELIQRVKASKPESKIIVVTGYETADLASEAKKIGADEFFLKPFDFSEFIAKIRHIESELKIQKHIINSDFANSLR